MAVERSEHDKKFDRQIRLWGVHGQHKLETTNIAVLNASATASETLKNLCLASTVNSSTRSDLCPVQMRV